MASGFCTKPENLEVTLEFPENTNHTVTQRMSELDDLWTKLKASRARHHAKVHVLRAVAWPRGLHAIASAPVGDSVWLELRRKATGALGCHKPGVNGNLLLGLVEALVDPQLVGLLWTCRSVRAQCTVDFWDTAVALVSLGELDLPPTLLRPLLLVGCVRSVCLFNAMAWSVMSLGVSIYIR